MQKHLNKVRQRFNTNVEKLLATICSYNIHETYNAKDILIPDYELKIDREQSI